ncbi:MAG: metal-dependent hydrolase, partial [Planctomycetota bacterium]
MQLEAHAGIGWILAQAATLRSDATDADPRPVGRNSAHRSGCSGADRRLRGAILLAAVLPDVDAASYLFDQLAYLRYHHVVGHNLFFGLAVSAAAAWFCRGRRLRALVFTQLAFWAHFFGDYFFTVYAISYLYPVSNVQILFERALPRAPGEHGARVRGAGCLLRG